jgi:hypothetical protein
MARDSILADIARSKAKIIATEESTVFSPEYKVMTLAQEREFIAKSENEIILIDKIMNPRMQP